jgi:ribose 5-phosphate isomerase B
MKVFLASDHAGFELKAKVVEYLKGLHFEVEDLGAHVMDEADDYPDYISLVAAEVFVNPNENRGIIFGGSGQGEAIVANRFKHVRACVYYGGNLDIVKLSREHNDSNVLSLGARFVGVKETLQAVDLWLTTQFTHEERHKRRIAKIDKLNTEN